MASVFTYDPNPPRVSSPWSTPGRATPQPCCDETDPDWRPREPTIDAFSATMHLSETGMTRLEPEPQEGPTEYKLHLLLRPRRALLSISNSGHPSGTQPSTSYFLKAGLRTTSLSTAPPGPMPSTHSRQARLQQLTTQLLWRLQQSSPFHSCSTANLVLPSLPEALPKLGVPRKPARLLPGLEESQGAMYEIGVSDDGTFVGLTEDEMEESLTNLTAMAASLGCVVEILRKVIVGQCEWGEQEHEIVGTSPGQVTVESLWVAEALVRPDFAKPRQALRDASPSKLDAGVSSAGLNGHSIALPKVSQSQVEQLRISIVGATNSGKSSLLGTLTTSTLDNGRGKSRLNLLKHRHEITSGVTSSVAQELIGYCMQPDRMQADIVNYASENVSSWNDIHASASRLIFFSDSPGLPRYSKSALRTLVSWNPNWTILCLAANSEEADVISPSAQLQISADTAAGSSKRSDAVGHIDPWRVHLQLCLKLDLPLMIVVTKMDIATKPHLRLTLGKLLSALKAAGKKPCLMAASDLGGQSTLDNGPDSRPIMPMEDEDIDALVKTVTEQGNIAVPIVLASAVTGQGIGKLHAMLRSIPVLQGTEATTKSGLSSITTSSGSETPLKIFQIDEVFAMPPLQVYSATRDFPEEDHGTVLCGYVSSSCICVGDVLKLGPFYEESQESNQLSNPFHQPTSSNPTIHPNLFPPGHADSTLGDQNPVKTHMMATSNRAIWPHVRIVSLRNLRLPTRSLLAGQVGTLGVQHIKADGRLKCDLRRARKGMVLASIEVGKDIAYRSFTASFPLSDFKALHSPPLILGGHATVYINSIRASVRVISGAVANEDNDCDSPGYQHQGVVDPETEAPGGVEGQAICIKFRFLSTVEWMRLHDRVLVIPNAVAAGPVSGASVAATAGLDGFVGIVSDLEI